MQSLAVCAYCHDLQRTREENKEFLLLSQVLGASGSDVDTEQLSPERSRAPRVIGGLPIAEYEGSPRRYGPRAPDSPLLHGVPALPSAQSLLSSPSVFPPRPGFPQRVVAPPQDETPRAVTPPPLPGVDGAYDYIYEFSETRKVLEEFFKPSSPPLSPTQPPAEGFHELDYNLHRQAGNSYVGQRLAKDGASPGAEVEEPPVSPPHKAGGTPDLISLRDHEEPASTEHLSPGAAAFLAATEHEVTSNVEEDLAETEVCHDHLMSIGLHAWSFTK